MATQYTAGLTTGQVLTAATMNSIGAKWEPWTPTVTANTGTITTLGTIVGRYTRFQKFVRGYISINITTNGTGGGSVDFTLPFTASSEMGVGTGIGTTRESSITGQVGIVWLDPALTKARIQRADTLGYPGANGSTLSGFFLYEAA